MPLWIYDAAEGAWRESSNQSPADGGVYRTAVRAWIFSAAQGVWRSFLVKDWVLPGDGSNLEKTELGNPTGPTTAYDWQAFLEGGIAQPLLRNFEPNLIDGELLITPASFPGLQNILAPGDKIRFVVDRECYSDSAYTFNEPPNPYPSDHFPAVAIYDWPEWLNLELEFLDNCFVVGRGGRGGRGEYFGEFSYEDIPAEDGGDGGVGLYLGNDVTLIGSSSVVIAGGGGGGGGGAAAEVRHSAPANGSWARAGGGGGNSGIMGQYYGGQAGGEEVGDPSASLITASAEGLDSGVVNWQRPSDAQHGIPPANGGRVTVADFQDGRKYANGGRGGEAGGPGQDGYPGLNGSVENQYGSLGKTGTPGAGGKAGPAVMGVSRIKNFADVDITFIGALLD